jgi:hypothetical protein
MDGGRYLIPLPNQYDQTGKYIDKNDSTKRHTISKVQYQLGKVLTLYHENYDDMLKQCKIEVVGDGTSGIAPFGE